jgi:hypothetical protein
MSYAGKDGAVVLVRCKLPKGARVYRAADGTLRDLPSNQPFWPVLWDAEPPPAPQDGRGIAWTEIVGDDLIVTYSDSTWENVGKVVGEDGNDAVCSVCKPEPEEEKEPDLGLTPAKKARCGGLCQFLVGTGFVGLVTFLATRGGDGHDDRTTSGGGRPEPNPNPSPGPGDGDALPPN